MRKDDEKYLEKAAVLVEALPYIQKFNRKVIVVMAAARRSENGSEKSEKSRNSSTDFV